MIVCDRVIWQTRPKFSRHNNTSLHHCEATLHRRTRTKCSVFKIRKDQLTCWLVKNEFWGQKHGYETDDLKGNFQLEVFDWESKSSSLSWSSWIHISFFQQLLFESISSVVWQIVSISGEKLKAKGKTKLLANYLKIFTWGYLRVAHKETHTVNNILVTASQFFKLSKLIGMCNINFSVGKIWISKEVSLWSDV